MKKCALSFGAEADIGWMILSKRVVSRGKTVEERREFFYWQPNIQPFAFWAAYGYHLKVVPDAVSVVALDIGFVQLDVPSAVGTLEPACTNGKGPDVL